MTSYASSSHTPPRNNRKVVKEFKPTAEQILVAERRSLAVFDKFGGAIRANSRRELVRFLAGEVHNRNRQLGDYRSGEFSTTLRAAVDAAIKSGKIAKTDGWFGRTSTVSRKTHHQKYPARGRKQAAKRVAA